MRVLKWVILTILIVILSLVATALLFFQWLDTQEARFYEARPLLNAMKAVHDNTSTSDSQRAQDELLKRLLLGTGKETSLAALSEVGFGCQKSKANLGRFTNPEDEFDCQLRTPVGMGYTHWIVGFDFDKSDRLRDAKVAIRYIFL
jgi:hypothetical protein